MKKWEENNMLKYHNSKIKNAKSTFSTTMRTSQTNDRSTSSKGRYKNIQYSSASITSSPLYSILSTFNLEVYTQSMVDLGYGYDFTKIKQLRGAVKQRLLDKIGVKSKDRSKLSTLLDYLSNMVFKISEIEDKKKHKYSKPNIPRIPLNRPTSKQKQTPNIKQILKSKFVRSSKDNKSTSAADDSVIIHRQQCGKIQPQYSRSFLVQRLGRKTQNNTLDFLNLNLQINKIKQMYLSYDSGALTSNITNIDIEQLANCLALEIFPYIYHQQISENLIQSVVLDQSTFSVKEQINDHPIMIKTNINIQSIETPVLKLPKVLEIVEQKNESLFESVIENNKQLIESIMIKSMIRQTQGKSPSQGSSAKQELEQSNLALMRESYSSKGLSSVCFGDNFINQDFNLLKRFQNKQQEEILKQLPTIHIVQDFIKNLLSSLRMQKQAPIFAFVYLKRLKERCYEVKLNQLNWRNITLTCLLLGSKVWDDCSLQNDTIAKLIPSHTVLQLNRLQKIFLKIIDYKLTITPKQYAQGYFQLRKHCRHVKHSKNLKPLTLQQIKGITRKSNQLQNGLRIKYKTSLNKSF